MSEILDVQAEEVSFPSTIPQGSYRMKIAGAFSTFVSEARPEENKISWTIINIPCEVLKAQDNVDAEELEEYGAVRGTRMTLKFFLPTDREDPKNKSRYKKSAWQLKRFLGRLGGEQPRGKTLEQWLDGSVHKEFVGDVTIKPKYNDPTEFENEIGRTYSVSTYPNAK